MNGGLLARSVKGQQRRNLPVEEEEPATFGQRIRGGLASGGPVGGLVAMGLDPYAPRERGVPNWYEATMGAVNQAGVGLRANLSGDPSFVDRNARALEALEVQRGQTGIDQLNAETRAGQLTIEQDKAQRLRDLRMDLEESGLDPGSPADRLKIAKIYLRHGMSDSLISLMKLIDEGREANVPKKLEYKSGDEVVTEIYRPGAEQPEVQRGPRKIGGGGIDIDGVYKVSRMRRAELGPLLDARLQNQRVIGFLDEAVQTGNPVAAMAGIRSFIQAIDQSVVREEERREISSSMGAFENLVAEMEKFAGKPPTELIRQTRAAAVRAMNDLGRIIASRDMTYHRVADAAGIPFDLIEQMPPELPPAPGAGAEAGVATLSSGKRVRQVPIGTNADGSTEYRLEEVP